MKRIIEETGSQGLESLLGERVLLVCAGYFYTGVLTGVNASCVELTEASVVFDLGRWDSDKYANAEKITFAKSVFVQTAAIESFMGSK